MAWFIRPIFYLTIFLVWISVSELGRAQTPVSTEANPIIPDICFPQTNPGAIPYYIGTGAVVTALLQPQNISSFEGVFHVSQYIGIDSDGDGMLEAYALGDLRSSGGGRAVGFHWLIGSEWINLIENLKVKNPSLYNEILGPPDSEVAIRLNDWRCTILAYEEGNIPPK